MVNEPPTPETHLPAEAIKSDLHYVQARSRDVLLGLTLAASVLWILFVPWTSQAVGREAWQGVWGLLSAVIIAWLIRDRAVLLSYLIYCVALFAAIVLLALGTGMDAAPYGFVVLAFVTGTLLSTPLVACFALASLIAILWLGVGAFGLDPLSIKVLGPIITTVSAIIVSWLSTQNLRTALDWTSHSMLQAARNAEQARERSGELVRALKSLDESAHRIERLNYQLQVALRAAREAEQLKARFAANISHELRTPLNLIVGFATLLFQRPELYGHKLPARYLHDLGIIYRNALQLQRLVDDVLDLSRLQSTGMTISPEPVDPAALVQETADTVRNLVEAEGLELIVQLAPDLPHITVDPTRIRQVLINLLSNAVRFTERGSITLSVEQQGGEMIFRVRDTGIGIAEADLPKLFKEFHKLEEPPARRGTGSGLGLAISKAFIELHGGRIWVESRLGEGSTFSFALPVDGEAGISSPSLPSHTRLQLAYNRGIVVALTRSERGFRLLRRHLPGRQVVVAGSIERARDLVHHLRPQWMVVDRAALDGTFPDAGAIAAALNIDHLPLLICSLPQDDRPLRYENIVGYLIKPVSNNDLLQAVRQLGTAVETVLVVDDDRDFTQLVSRLLELPPRVYRVLKAFSAQEALQLALARSPDLILLDLALPDMRGEVLLEQMARLRTLAEVPVIVITGEADPTTLSAAGPDGNALTIMQQGADGPGGQVFEWIRTLVGDGQHE